MTKYELSISADYVPTWGVTDAVRELFQNALDEETSDANNKMFFDYNEDLKVLRIGNKNSTLDIKSLLIGNTSKGDNKYIGKHGEGYKIATMVLLRTGHDVMFANYNVREVWTTKLVKSRKYAGALVPTFFVEKEPIWYKVPDNALIIRITNVTPEEYTLIRESNLHIKGLPEHRDTKYGKILTDPAYKGHIYVSGLYVCQNSQITYGYDFTPEMIKLDRDRRLVDTFNICWTASKLIVATNDIPFIKSCLGTKDGEYLQHADYSAELRSAVAADFKSNHPNAVPVSTMAGFNEAIASGIKAVMVTEAEEHLIKWSKDYVEPEKTSKTLLERIEDWYDKLCNVQEDSMYRHEIESTVNEFETLLEALRGVLK